MGKFKLEITLGNDAMQSTDDIADALSIVLIHLRGNVSSWSIFDRNGNKVGQFETVYEKEHS